MPAASFTVLLPTSVADLAPDDPVRIGPYRLIKRLGSGGMGLVYAGHDKGGQLVAVKLIHSEYSSGADFRARFAREVELLGRVGGACAVPLLDADTEAARPWLATPLIRGATLSGHLRDHGPLNEALLRGLAAGVAEALAQIHDAGIVHRDLKPSNILLSAEGPRVLDFGVARAIDQTALTRTGAMSGSPGWISPEHYRGEPVSTSDDVFAWGALVVYAATGRPPFGSGNPAAVAHRVLGAPADMAGFSGPLADLALRALRKHAADRPTALELVHAVVQAGSPGQAIAPVQDVGTAVKATGAVLDHDWHGVGTGAEREYEIPVDKEGWGGGGGRGLARAGVALGSLVLLVGLVAGGTALGQNWEDLPIAAWFADEEGREPTEEKPSEEEVRATGTAAQETTTVPLAVYNAEATCQAPRAPECAMALVHDPYTAYAADGNRAGQVWHEDTLDATCMVTDGTVITDESGKSSSSWYRVTVGGGTTAWLPGVRTRDVAPVRTCESDEL